MGSFAKQHRQPIHFIRCKDKNHMDCYFFVMCSPQKIKLLQQKVNFRDGVDTVNLALCGTIVASGFGMEPPEVTRDMLAERDNYTMPGATA